MDIRIFGGVLWRFRAVVIAGALLAFLLAFLTVFRVSLAGGIKLEYRQDETWISHARLLVTQKGFPQGRADLVQDQNPAAAAGGADAPRYLDPGRSVELAMLYARIANADEVRSLMFRNGPVAGGKQVAVTAERDLPTMEVAAIGTSRASAVALAQRQVRALQEYLATTQRDNGVPSTDRIQLGVVQWPGARSLIEDTTGGTYVIGPRSKVRPALVFFAVLGLAIGLAFVLENVRPRLRAVDGEARSEGDVPSLAKSA